MTAADLVYQPDAATPRALLHVLLGLRILLAAFFSFLAVRNLAGDETMARDFARWGYPDWFRVATAVIQLGGAALLLPTRGAFWGALVLAAVLLGAIATHLRHDPLATAVSPVVVLALVGAVAVLHRPPLWR